MFNREYVLSRVKAIVQRFAIRRGYSTTQRFGRPKVRLLLIRVGVNGRHVGHVRIYTLGFRRHAILRLIVTLAAPVKCRRNASLIEQRFVNGKQSLRRVTLSKRASFSTQQLKYSRPIRHEHNRRLSRLVRHQRAFVRRTSGLYNIVAISSNNLKHARTNLNTKYQNPRSNDHLSNFNRLTPLLLERKRRLACRIGDRVFNVGIATERRSQRTTVINTRDKPDQRRQRRCVPVTNLNLTFRTIFHAVRVRPGVTLNEARLDGFAQSVVNNGRICVRRLQRWHTNRRDQVISNSSLPLAI